MAKELDPLFEQHKSLSELAYEAIREKIISGAYGSGEWLRQEDLSLQLAISHTPVRQALDWLVADGLAERVPNKGVRVSVIDREVIAEIYSLRLILEPVVVRLAALNASEEFIAKLSDVLSQSKGLTSLDDISKLRRLNRRFHTLIGENCGAPILSKLYETIWNRFPDWMFYEGGLRDIDSIKARFQREYEEHQAVFDALASGDAERAMQLSADHIQSFIQDDLEDLYGIDKRVLDEKRRQMGV